MTLQRHATSNQRWKNIVYVNVEIHNIEQRWNKVVFFNVEFNNVEWQRRNNVVIFNVDFHNFTNMFIWKNKLSLDSKIK